ncbi:hypothetical protein [Ferrimonas lipolytica]|uniref:Uncharacterized protein n=1 Tax=Ferrimonas lipolytica TaxID=2724191 RepID=A0A6H1UBW5_9GAMM|nr:hypothetical protein [Ferrimonas lipolytica]QIZ76139.1 hypothetical protein HER31_04075 [Ferrimonas lipolytica]
MFTKLLITIAVIAAMFWLGKRKAKPVKEADPLPASPASVVLQKLAPVFAIVALMLATTWFGYNWWHNQQVMEVTVTSSLGEISIYHVKRADVNGRRLVTVDGFQIELSQLDRVEVVSLSN